LQLTGGLFSSNVTDVDKKDTKAAEGGETKSLFKLTNQGTAGQSSLFGLSNFSFNFNQASTQAKTGGGSSVFSGGSLFGGPGLTQGTNIFGNSNVAPTAGGLFTLGAGGVSLFNDKTPLFAGHNSLFSNPLSKVTSKAENEENEDDDGEDGDGGNESSDSPPAYASDGAQIPGVTDKPLKLNIVPMKPVENPFKKDFCKQVEKFKIVPKAAVPKGAAEEKKGETTEKKSLGKGYLSLEHITVKEAK
jgi:hypothetical protein